MADKKYELDAPDKVISEQLPRLKPIATDPVKLAHYREGNFCGRCNHFMPLKEGRLHFIKRKFWDGVFHRYNDGSDAKPITIGKLDEYSVCKYMGCTTNFFSPACQYFRTGLFARTVGGL